MLQQKKLYFSVILNLLAILAITPKNLLKNALETIKIFLSICNDKYISSEIDGNSIVNMDHTSIYINSPSNYTYAKRGSKRVKYNT